MKVFKYEGYEVKIAPEALALRPFKKIWEKDKSKNKENATQEMSFLYFYCDPRSDYQYIVDDEDRLEAVKKGIGFEDKWKPDATLQAAIAFYRTFDSPAAILLRTASEAVDKVQKTIKDLTPDDTKSLKEYLTTLKLIPEVATMLRDAEKALAEEMEYGEAAGSIEKGMFEDGLDEVAEWTDNQKY